MAGNRFQLARGLLTVKKGGATQHLGYSIAGTVSATLSSQCIGVLVYASTECMIDINPSGTTVTSSTGAVIPANTLVAFEAKGGKDVVSAAQYSATGRIHITEIVAPNDV